MNVLSNTHKIRLFIFLSFFPQVFCVNFSRAQVVWGSSTGSAWMTGANWLGGSIPVAGQITEFDSNPTSATTGIGINMDTASGSVAVGAIFLSSLRPNGLLIGNSSPSTPGVLSLTGATVSGISSVALANLSANFSTLTIQNTQGAGTSSMITNFGATPQNILTGQGSSTGIGNTINITSVLAGTGLLTFLGGGSWNYATASGNNGGLLKLGGSNSFSGGLNVGNGDGTSNGILELDAADAVSNVSGNNIIINANSQLYLGAIASSTYNSTNITLTLNGMGNNYSVTGKGALINHASYDYTWPGLINLATDAGIAVSGSATDFMILSGNISGPGQLVKQGIGNLILSGTGNTWIGGTNLANGALTVNSGSSLSTGPLIMGQTGVPPSLSLNNASQTVSSLSSTFSATSGSVSQIITLGSGTTLTVNQSINTTYGNGSTTTLRSFINGSGALVKNGAGILTFTSYGHSFTGGLTISGGELRFSTPAATNITLGSCPVVLNGGTLGTKGIGLNISNNISFSTLTLTDNSGIDLDSATIHTIKFAASTSVAWTTGKILTIRHWRGGFNGTAGTVGRIFVSTSTLGLTGAQLSQIRFTDTAGNLYLATLLSNGELVAATPVINTTTAAYGPYCSNTSNVISIPFTYSGPFTSAFKVQLSNPSGVFTNDFVTGIVGSGTTSPITATIPSGTMPGTAYRIRVICQTPEAIFGSNNGSNITLTGAPAVAAISGPAILTNGTSVTFSDGTSGGVWSSSNTSVATISSTGAAIGVATGNAVISYSVTNSCSLTTVVTLPVLVFNIPVITSFSPASAITGGVVTVTGTNFDTTASNNVIFFGAQRASVNAASATSLTVNVPSGATFAPLVLLDTVSSLNAVSVAAFTPSYSNAGLIPDSIHFLPKVDFDAGTNPVGIVMADLDGDGRNDMIVTNSGPNTVYLYRNISTGGTISAASFATPISLATDAGPHYVKVADLDGDGKPDIVVANTSVSSNKISVYHNNSVSGAFAFAAKVDFATIATAPIDIAVADFDGDGKPDIAVINQNSSKVAVFRNLSAKGILTTSSFTVPVNFNTGTFPFKIFAGDLDGDGKPDMAITDYTAGSVSLFHNTASSGSITASSFGAPISLTTAAAPIGIAGCDVDGDGKTDLLVTNSTANTFTIYRNTNTAAGTFSFASGVNFNTGLDPEDFALADIDGDGKTDIAVGNYSSNTVSVFRNTAISGSINSGSLAPKVDLVTGTGPSGMALADVNGDGKADLEVVDGTSSTISILRNYPLPPIAPVTGPDSICISTPTTFSSSVGGGYWSSNHPSIATVSASGVVTGLAPGRDTIFYSTVAQGDSSVVSLGILVEVHVAVGPVTGISNRVCAGASLSLSDTVATGYWASSNPAIATVDTSGFVTGHAVGTAIITYAITNSCGTSADTMNIEVIPSTGYVIGAIAGGSSVCSGSTTIFSDTTASGAWASDDTTIATVNTFGVVRGVSYGTTIITYGFSGICGIYQSTRAISVDTLLIAATIAGPDSVCQGAMVTLVNPAGTGGSWIITNGSAFVMGGVVSGLSPGMDTIIYSYTNVCGTTTVNKSISIDPLPYAGSISGSTYVCIGAPVTLTDTIAAGTWSKSNGKASISGAGLVSGVAAGNDTMFYIVTNGCGIDTAWKPIAVLPVGAGVITGASAVCAGSAIALSDTTRTGTWSWTSFNGNATVNGSGVVTGLTAGTDSIIYSLTTVCGTSYAIKKITINPLPVVDTLSGPSLVCIGASITLTDSTAGGTWTKTNNTATVTAGVVHGVTAGADTIIYSVNLAGCIASVTKAISVLQLTAGTISGPTNVCAGTYILLKDNTPGGIWANTGGHSTFVDSVFTGLSAGKDTVTYKVSGACGTISATKIITINPLPFADTITGAGDVIVGDTIALRDGVKGGIWASINSNAIITATGSVGGLRPGTDTIVYLVTNVCGTDTALFPLVILSADNLETITDVNIYPNPSKGQFTILVTSLLNESVEVLVANSVFQILSLNNMNTNTPTTMTLNEADGVYFISIISKHSWNNLKLVIIH